MTQQPFDEDMAHDYILAHGFGPPSDEGMDLARELYAEGKDYATIGHEVVYRRLFKKDYLYDQYTFYSK